jgi:hypothetical protein
MLRGCFTVLAGLSALGVVIVSAVWASYLLPPRFWLGFSTSPGSRSGARLSAECLRDAIVVTHLRHSGQAVVGPSLGNAAGVKDFIHQFGGLTQQDAVLFDRLVEPAFANTPQGRIEMFGTRTIYLVPYWALVVVSSILPAWRWLPTAVRWWKARRLGVPGHCRKCGYDLRATPQRCPECGTPAEGR